LYSVPRFTARLLINHDIDIDHDIAAVFNSNQNAGLEGNVRDASAAMGHLAL